MLRCIYFADGVERRRRHVTEMCGSLWNQRMICHGESLLMGKDVD